MLPRSRQANCSLTPSPAAGDERLAAGAAVAEMFPFAIRSVTERWSYLLERDFLRNSAIRPKTA